jgi:hypothetical protein
MRRASEIAAILRALKTSGKSPSIELWKGNYENDQ